MPITLVQQLEMPRIATGKLGLSERLVFVRCYQNQQKTRSQRGAAAVELALVLPLLLILVFGIVDFGAAWSQKTDVHHGAREVARIAAVNYNPLVETGSAQTATIVAAACSRMGDGSEATVSLTLDPEGTAYVGDVATVLVSQPYNSITGFTPIAATLSSQVQFRLEQPASWSSTSAPIACAP